MVALRIGEIPYLNCTPLFHYLKTSFRRPGYSFIRETPARLNSLLARGRIDVAPCSSIEYAFHPQRYLLIPEVSISANGPIKSVLLFSHRPLRSLNGQRIALTSASASGAALLRIIFRKFLKLEVRFVPMETSLTSIPQEYEAALVIGNYALKNRDRAPYVFDLGTLWRRFTRTYCVFSLWIVRKDAYEKNPVLLNQLSQDLMAAKSRARGELPSLVGKISKRHWISQKDLISYWKGISYDLTPSHIAGLRTFYRLAREVGVISRVPSLRFLGR